MAVSTDELTKVLGYSNADMRQYNGYGQSNPYGSNGGYDNPPTYSTFFLPASSSSRHRNSPFPRPPATCFDENKSPC